MSKRKIKLTQSEKKRRRDLAKRQAMHEQLEKRNRMMQEFRALDDLDLLQFLPKPAKKETTNDSIEQRDNDSGNQKG